MGENTKIEWAHHTFNPWTGCQKVSPGCDHCYAEGWAKRSGVVEWGPHANRRRTSSANWKKPLQWNKAAEVSGERYRVFCASLADVFDNQVDPSWRADLFALIKATPHLDWLLLTKRPENIAKMLPDDWGDGYPNVWLGTTVEDQDRMRRIGELLRNRAALHFLSCEPLLGPVDISPCLSAYWTAINCPQARRADGSWTGQRISWVICGGESGPDARPMHPEWARSLREQCEAAGVAFFLKQWGEWVPLHALQSEGPEAVINAGGRNVSGSIDLQDYSCARMFRVGKKAAGRLLDGREHNEFPAISA
jgi:protein gp37